MNTVHEVFLSIVIVIENENKDLEKLLRAASDVARMLVTDHEIVVIDNGSEDETSDRLRTLCGEQGIPNIQVYRLAKNVEKDIAAWAGVEKALGDYTAVVNPTMDDINALPDLLEASIDGADVVFGVSRKLPKKSISNRIACRIFKTAIGRILGIDANREMPYFRLLNRKVINYTLQHQTSGLAYRLLPAASGFRTSTVTYDNSAQPSPENLLDDIDRGIRLLVSSSFGPMRIVTLLSLSGAALNLVYSFYVIAVGIFQEDVAPGWITLSLQQSGMFFLFSIVLLVLGEYIIHMTKLAANAPDYYVTDEFSSVEISRQERLNVEISAAENSAGTLNEAHLASSPASVEP